MKGRHAKSLTARRWARILATVGLAATPLGAAAHSAAALSVPHAASGAGAGSFAATKTLTRSNVVNGAEQTVDTRRFHVTVSATQNLRDRQEIAISWSGAHPTGGDATDTNSYTAATQEYPVVMMMCRGTTSTAAPDTCWTATPSERAQSDQSFNFPPYRLDQYASVADRGDSVGVPSPLPDDCKKAGAASGIQHWVPFIGADGTRFGFGPNGCAGLPPEATITDATQPSNTTYGTTRLDGTGSTDFVITTDQTNATLGCSQKVACSLAIVPIMGISCDPEAFGLPAADQPPTPAVAQQAADECESTGNYAPGSAAPATPNDALTVSGQLWWSASNWGQRIMVPLTFAQSDNVCSVVSSSAPLDIYGSPLLTQATEQWSPYFCTNSKLFNLKHVITSEPEAKNLLETGSISAAFQGAPPETPFSKPVVQSPTAFTGFAVVYKIDDLKGKQYFDLKMNARLLAKLLSESYPANVAFRNADPALSHNPIDLALDPEFQALNPGLPDLVSNSDVASTILTLSSDSDTTWALTSYINADPAARAFLDGKPDPWGMTVNPAYKGIKLPATTFPLLDNYIPKGFYTGNVCLEPAPVPYLPLVASPLESQALITLDMQYNISNAQINCVNVDPVHLTAVGREIPGQRFELGITSLADAQRYALPTAALQTSDAVGADKQYDSAAGKTFAAPDAAGLAAAAKSLVWDTSAKTFALPYATLPSSATGRAAYPGSVLLSTDVPTQGLAAATAKQYATFLDFAASRGQQPGSGNGDLPPGFLPMTAANGFGPELAYAKGAALAVAAQAGQLPAADGSLPAPATNPGGGASGGDSTSGGGGGAVSSTGTGAGGSGSGSGTTTSAGGSTPPPTKPTTRQSSSPTTAPSSAPRGITAKLSASAVAAAAVPAMLLLGVAAAVALLAMSGVFRRGGAR